LDRDRKYQLPVALAQGGRPALLTGETAQTAAAVVVATDPPREKVTMIANPPTQANQAPGSLLSLEPYWRYVEKMRLLHSKKLASANANPFTQTDQSALAVKSYVVYLSYLARWSVVVEASEERPICNTDSYRLFLSGQTKLLGRFRNVMLHYMSDYFTLKLFKFFSYELLNWLQSLHERRISPLTKSRFSGGRLARS
jgi:hypothetical protein